MSEEVAALREEVQMLRQMLGAKTVTPLRSPKMDDELSLPEVECMSPTRPPELLTPDRFPELSPIRSTRGLVYSHQEGGVTRVDRKNAELETMWVRYGSNAKVESKKREVSFYGKPWGDVVCLAAEEVLMQLGCRVETLNLGCANITSAGVAALGRALRSPTHTLRCLKLNGNPSLTDTGVDILLKSLSPYIHTLELGDCGITSEGTANITCTMPHLPNLRCLYLYCNPDIGDLGAAHFAEAVSHGYELDTLNLQNCGVSGDARRWITAACIKVDF